MKLRCWLGWHSWMLERFRGEMFIQCEHCGVLHESEDDDAHS